MRGQEERFTATEADSGMRLDVFVQARMPEVSRSRAAGLIREAHVTLNGRSAKPSASVQRGDVVEVAIPAPEPLGLAAQDIAVGVVYEDEQIIVVDKPAGLTVHPAPGHPDGTLVNALLALVPELPGIGGTQRPGIVHRLDKDTSGLIVVAKTDAAHRSLTRQLKERSVGKTYLALVSGLVKGDGSIDAPIGRNPRRRKQMGGGRIRPSGSHGVSGPRAVRRAAGQVHVGRGPPHDRADAPDPSSPGARWPSLVGDPVYGKRSVLVPRHFLHAARLELAIPPGESERRTFESPLPEDLAGALAALRG